MPNKHKHLLAAYQHLQEINVDCVLATIIETFGSTYQKAGARMLITAQDELLGLLGGGCFETDLVEQARSVFETGTPKTLFYDMRSSQELIWGLGLGCNGAVRVLLQLLKAKEGFSPLNQIVQTVEGTVPGLLITVYESKHADFPAGSNYYYPALNCDQSRLASVPFPFASSAQQAQWQQKSRLETHVINGKELKAFYDPLQPALRLLILGSGADVIPLIACAKGLGWQVTLVDYRPAHLKPDRFPQADHVLQILPEALSAELSLNEFNALILMTHNIESDQRYLKSLVASNIPFIGLLGPAQRRDRLLQSLGSDAESLNQRVFGPVGLDIGAETPEEIALAIMAGIHSELRGRSGYQLSQSSHVEAHVSRQR